MSVRSSDLFTRNNFILWELIVWFLELSPYKQLENHTTFTVHSISMINGIQQAKTRESLENSTTEQEIPFALVIYVLQCLQNISKVGLSFLQVKLNDCTSWIQTLQTFGTASCFKQLAIFYFQVEVDTLYHKSFSDLPSLWQRILWNIFLWHSDDSRKNVPSSALGSSATRQLLNGLNGASHSAEDGGQMLAFT